MTPTDLRLLGEALYGKNWKSPLARRLGTDHKTVWRWATGVHRPSGWYAKMIQALWDDYDLGVRTRRALMITEF